MARAHSRASSNGGLVERGRRLARARVVHEHIDPAPVRERGRDERRGRAVQGEIARHHVRVAQLGRQLLQPFGAPGREDDASAGGIEHAGEPSTEPGARAGHDRHLVVEPEWCERVERHGLGI
jgi:hypothetical protein